MDTKLSFYLTKLLKLIKTIFPTNSLHPSNKINSTFKLNLNFSRYPSFSIKSWNTTPPFLFITSPPPPIHYTCKQHLPHYTRPRSHFCCPWPSPHPDWRLSHRFPQILCPQPLRRCIRQQRQSNHNQKLFLRRPGKSSVVPHNDTQSAIHPGRLARHIFTRVE